MPHPLSMVVFASLALAFVAGIEDGGCPGWCASNPNAPNDLVQAKLDYVCGQGGDCGPIQPGQPCYVPKNVKATASYAFNDYYIKGSDCIFEGAAKFTKTDPSHGDCKFPCGGRTPATGDGDFPEKYVAYTM